MEQLVKGHRICKRCLGRAFGRHKSQEVNITLHSLASVDSAIVDQCVESSKCELCFGAVDRVLALSTKIITALSKYEFSTFLIGVTLSKDYAAADTVYKSYGLEPLLLKHEISRELGLRLNSADVDFELPDITILLKLTKSSIRYKFTVKSLYVLGKYRKFSREIPQTKWPCTHCKGKKCEACNYTGFQYPTSVEQEIAPPLVAASDARDESFHGAGREDIDALMLGTGRPFVLELKHPRIRSIDLVVATQQINASKLVEVEDLRFCEKSTIHLLKSSSTCTHKIYRAHVESTKPLRENDFQMLSEYMHNPLLLDQQTPVRVAHRRADLHRSKTVFAFHVVEQLDSMHFVLEIEAEGGTYIKEFISGDSGRTVPSISSLLNKQSVCTQLDVIFVDSKGLFS